MVRNKNIILFSIIFFGLFGLVKNSLADCTGSGLIWNCTAGTTVAQVNSALSSASDGATINFAAGNYNWNSGINIQCAKAVSLIGAGAGSSIANIAGGNFSHEGICNGGITSTGLYRISGFTFNGGIPGGNGLIYFYAAAGIDVNVRIDHNTFDGLDPGGLNSSLALVMGTTWCPSGCGNVYGVADHNTITGNDNYMFIKVLGHGDNYNETSSPKGTDKNFYVEDNTANFTNGSNLGAGLIDCWNSGSIVFRHNTVTNNLLAAHEESHGGGCLNFEAYDNTLAVNSGIPAGAFQSGYRLIHHQGSGEIFLFNNSFSAYNGKSGSAISLTEYRSCPLSYDTGSSLPECDGTQAIDGNWSPTGTYYGYPCWRQPGRMKAGSVTSQGQPGTLSPIYVWNNYWSDTHGQVNLALENPWGCPGPPTPDTHIKANRDWYNAVSALAQSNQNTPFDGTTGMGFGTLANRPTTCTTNSLEQGGGVGYFATDQGPQGTLYRCSATNTWTIQYQPYTYPHPLTLGGSSDATPPAVPSGLSVQ